jgi:hypothetical protein
MIQARATHRSVHGEGLRWAAPAIVIALFTCSGAVALAATPFDSTGALGLGVGGWARALAPMTSSPAWTFAADAASLVDGTPAARWAGALGIGLWGPLGAELRTSAAAAFEPRGGPLSRNEVRLTYGSTGYGGWLGVGRDDSFEGESSEAMWSMGGWAGRQGLSFTARLEQMPVLESLAVPNPVAGPDTGGTGDPRLGPSNASGGPNATAAQIGVVWSRAQWTAEFVGGVAARSSGSSYRWCQAAIAVPIRPGLAGFATAGSPTPQWLALGPIGDRRASLGLRFTGWSGAARGLDQRPIERLRWRLDRAEEDEYTLTVRVSGAREVEVMGDPTHWIPVRLDPAEPGRWRVVLQLPPGVHELNLRIDGGPWLPPPGLPTRRDEYNGEVGVIVIA